MNNNSLCKIIDYLKVPSIGEVQDYSRRRDLWLGLNIDEIEHEKKIENIKKKFKREETIARKIREEQIKYHKRLETFSEIDSKSKELENELMNFDSCFSENLAKNRDTPNEIKSLYKKWSKTPGIRKFKSENLGEEIVALYYRLRDIKYERNIEVPSGRSEENSKNNKYHKPDGLENNTFYVEVKMRAYQSSGTANEKIPSVAFKYADLPKKIKLYLLADDEHGYNTYWSKLIRGDIKSSNKYNSQFENEYKRIHKVIIEKIVYGSELAEELEKFIKKFS